MLANKIFNIRKETIKFKNNAKELIKEYNTTDPFKLADYLKIEIVYLDYVDWYGAYTPIQNKKYIFLNGNLDKASQIFVCAHELGHYFHEYKHVLTFKNYVLFGEDSLEKEANIFAAFLISKMDTEYLFDIQTETSNEILKVIMKYL